MSRVLLRSFRRVCAKVPSILILLPFFVAGPAVAQTTSLVANPDTAVVEKDSSVVIHVVGNDTGPTGSVTIETNVSPQAKRGWLSSDHASGTITYNPYNAQVGRDEFGYQLRGADGSLSNPTTVSVAIGNPPPLADCEPAGSANRHVSLLLVGNSLMNDVQSKLDILFSCGGYTFDIATSNPGGSFLHQHHTHEKTTNLIARGYDLTLIQEQSSGITAHSPPYDIITPLKRKIEAAGSQLGFYQTWGLQDREPVKTEAILSGYEQIAAYFDAPIIPIGRAWDYFYTKYNENPPFSLYVDYAHPSEQGKALITYVIYAYLTGESPVNTPALVYDEDESLLLQQIAWEVMKGKTNPVTATSPAAKAPDPVRTSSPVANAPNPVSPPVANSSNPVSPPAVESSNLVIPPVVSDSIPVSGRPFAVNDSVSVEPGNVISIDVLSNDSGEGGVLNPRSLFITAAPTKGTMFVRSNGLIEYTNTDTTASSDSFKYTIADTDGTVSNVAGVYISIEQSTASASPVTPNVTQPVSRATTTRSVSGGSKAVEPVLLKDSDADGVPVAITSQVTNAGLTAVHRSGQTFITWDETSTLDGYHVYRHTAPVTAGNINSAEKLTSRWGALDSDTSVNKHGGPNVPANYVIEDLGAPLSDSKGLFVYTTQPGDSASAYYAVTSVRKGKESISTLQALNEPLVESVSPPRDVLTLSVNGGKGRVYTQYMDYSQWNPTFNGYAYGYSVALPSSYNPDQSYPLQIQLHAYGEIYKSIDVSEYDWDVIQLLPHDPGAKVGARHSWWYGYAADHDYTSGSPPTNGRIENFTEQRVMRSVKELLLNTEINVDQRFIHAYGHSMGGSGVLSMGMRYPNVLSGVYASEPMTNYAGSARFVEELERLWGSRSINLPIVNTGPYSQRVHAYDNVGVWDWMNHHKQLRERRGDDMAYLMTFHGKQDTVIEWHTQGVPMVQSLTDANAGFSAVYLDMGHSWSGFNPVVRSMFGMDSSVSFRWIYPLGLSFPAIQNASGSSNIAPANSGEDRYNLDLEWATAHTPFDTAIVDSTNRYEVTIRSNSADQTADITPRRTNQFRVNAGQPCAWSATDRTNQRQLAAGSVTADSDSLVTVSNFPIVTGKGTRLVLDCA